MFDGVGAKTDPLLAPTIPLALFCFVSDEVCHHNSFFDNRLFCRAREVLRLSRIHDAFLYFCILPIGSLDLASGRLPSSDGGC